MTVYFCCTEQRRNLVRAHPMLNGIDFLEVQDDDTMSMTDRQRFLQVTLLKPSAAPLRVDNVRIDEGAIAYAIRVTNVVTAGNVLEVEVEQPGDYDIFTLRLTAGATADEPPPGFDLPLAAIDFSFKVNCETDFDCDDAPECPPPTFQEPELDYLARDFNSLRTVMLDRIQQLAPDWQETHVADLMHALVDLKAYVADYQHYQLDAINTEAYLFTARRRVSVRRHARLVGYRMHDGVSARVWVHLRIDPDIPVGVTLPAHTPLFTRVSGLPLLIVTDLQKRQLREHQSEGFATLHEAVLFSAHNEICFYTWGEDNCVLPRGATKATLAGHYPHLQPGQVLLFTEVRGAETGDPADADPAKRFAVRLIATSLAQDELTESAITHISWHPEDALPAPLCISANVPDTSEKLPCDGAISVARGNMVLAAHGRQIDGEDLGEVPVQTLQYVHRHGRCDPDDHNDPVPPRYRPQLAEGPICQHADYKHEAFADPADPRSATAAMQVAPTAVLPQVTLATDATFAGDLWHPQHDLLNSQADAEHFVVEVENDGVARLRFGDDRNGQRPNAGNHFYARYRVGDLLAGNIGVATLGHLISDQTAIVHICNPLPGSGGTAPESIEATRQNAPQAFRVQRRAVTPRDYEARALGFPTIQRAAATLRWTGSWYTVFLTVDRLGSAAITPAFERDLIAYLNQFRMMGYDLEVDAPHYVPIELALEICVEPTYFRAAVRAALRTVLSSRVLTDGTKGLFHPDNFTFGQPLYLSRIYAAIQPIAGVQSVTVTRFQAQDQPARSGLASGVITLGRLEIARLDNDPNFPKNGVVRLTLKGGQ